MAAGTALVALSLFVTLVQVSAQILCFPTVDCELDSSEKVDNVSSKDDCCLMEPTPRSYIDDSSPCRTCIVAEVSIAQMENETMYIQENSTEVDLPIRVYIKPQSSFSETIHLEIFPSDDCTGIPDDTAKDIQLATYHFNISDGHCNGDSKCFTPFPIMINNDRILEGTETFCAMLSAPPIVEVRGHNLTIELEDDDFLTIGFKSIVYDVHEREESLLIVIEAKGDVVSEIPINITVKVIDGEAEQLKDFIGLSTEGPLPPDPTIIGYYVIVVFEDDVLEDKETFTLELTTNQSSVNVSKEFSTTVVTIYDDNTLKIGFSSITYNVSEGAGYLSFEVQIKSNGTSELPINFTVTDRQGYAHPFHDYNPLDHPTLMLKPRHKLVQGNITIVNDSVVERYRENFTLHLETSQSNVRVHDRFNTTTVTIIDDDKVTIGFDPDHYSVVEGSGTVDLTIVAKGELNRSVEVTVSTSGCSSNQGKAGDKNEDDFVPIRETLSFSDNTSKTITVTIKNDTFFEKDETFFAMLCVNDSIENGVTLSSNNASFTIRNDDTLLLSLWSEALVVESRDSITVNVSATGIVLSPVKVNVYTVSNQANGYAQEYYDYEPLNHTFDLISDSNSTKQMSVSIPLIIKDDNLFEKESEAIEIHMRVVKPRSSDKIIVLKNWSYAAIQDDDGLEIGFKNISYSVTEGNGILIFEVEVNGDSALPIYFVVSDTEGTAKRGEDYEKLEKVQHKLAPHSKSFKGNVTVLDDDVREQNKAFDLHLNTSQKRVSVIQGRDKAVVTITDDDTPLYLRLWSATLVSESKCSILVSVIADGIVRFPVKLRVYTVSSESDGFATEDDDYEPLNKTVELIPEPIPTNQMRVDLDLEIVNDTLFERHYEKIKIGMDLIDPQSSDKIIILKSQSIATIKDDDDLKIGFKNAQYYINEGDGSLTFEVVSSSDFAIPIAFTVSDTEGNAIRGVDYEGLENVQHKLMPDSESFQGYVTIIDDVEAEPIETFSLVLSSKQRRVSFIGGLNKTVVTITDDDNGVNAASSDTSAGPSENNDPGQGVHTDSESVHTVNDTVISGGLMTVPINVLEFGSDLHLCYQINGKPDKYFNFVSDECTSVNAHYARVPGASFNIIMDSISIVAVDDRGNCHQINVDAAGCSATFDASEENGISVHSYTSRVRVSVPNCEDNKLVMWVFCQKESFYNPFTNSQTDPIDVIKFEITRGLNLTESSHGLLGQFWNIPVTVTKYEGPHNNLFYPDQEYYVVTVAHPSSPSRSFVGPMHGTSWEDESKQCIYVGSSQGGRTGEVADADDSVIEGSYTDYITAGPFGTDFKYAVFDDAVCSSS